MLHHHALITRHFAVAIRLAFATPRRYAMFERALLRHQRCYADVEHTQVERDTMARRYSCLRGASSACCAIVLQQQICAREARERVQQDEAIGMVGMSAYGDRRACEIW